MLNQKTQVTIIRCDTFLKGLISLRKSQESQAISCQHAKRRIVNVGYGTLKWQIQTILLKIIFDLGRHRCAANIDVEGNSNQTPLTENSNETTGVLDAENSQ